MPPKKGKEKEIEKSPEELQIQKLADDVLDYVKVDKASFINETKMLTKMVEDGTDMDSPGAEDGNTPLITAAISNYMKACKILIDDGHADVNKAGLGGMTALHHSCRMGEQVDLMLYLVDEAKCDIHAVDDVGG